MLRNAALFGRIVIKSVQIHLFEGRTGLAVPDDMGKVVIFHQILQRDQGNIIALADLIFPTAVEASAQCHTAFCIGTVHGHIILDKYAEHRSDAQ